MAIVLFILAACLMTVSEWLLARANLGVRLPFWGTPPRDPVSAKTARGLAVGLALFGSISLTDRIGWWGVVLIAAVLLLPVCVVRLLQSRLEPAQPVH